MTKTMTTTYLIFQEDTLLIQKNKNTLSLPTNSLIKTSDVDTYDLFLLFESETNKTYLIDVSRDFECPDSLEFKDVRECRNHFKDPSYPSVIQGLQLLNWSRKHQYCGVCGSKFSSLNPDKSKKCPDCGNLLFPQTSMAVITAILKDDQILLAHNANFPEGLYSLIAGFVELGETLEDAVEREIFEEVGLKVKNLRYFGSQPWPFPNSMMIGFMADYESGDITPDNFEILDAQWFDPSNFPDIPHDYSIARQIINTYTQGS